MKKLFTVLFFGISFFSIVHSQPPIWVPQGQGLVPHWHGIYDISVVDENTVWALTINDLLDIPDTINQYVLRTVDGGLNWEPRYMEEFFGHQITSLSGISDSIAWLSVVGFDNNTARFYKTSDAGVSWDLKHTVQGGNSEPFPILKFVDEDKGYYIDFGSGAKMGYTNSGEDWIVVDLPSGPGGGYFSVECPQAWFAVQDTFIWVADSKSIRRSTNGGLDWGLTNIPGNFSFSTVAFDENGYGLINSSVDFDLGWPGPNVFLDHTIFYNSDDFGETWQFQSISNLSFPLGQSVAVPGEEKTFVGISGFYGWLDPSIERSWASAFTTDGGYTWTRIDEDIPYTGIGFASKNVGWIGAVGNFDYGYPFDQKPIIFKLDGMISSSAEVLEPGAQISAWPNPVSDLLNIEWPETLKQDAAICIFNIQGQKMWEQNLVEGQALQVGHLAPGLYTLKLANENVAYAGKFMKL